MRNGITGRVATSHRKNGFISGATVDRASSFSSDWLWTIGTEESRRAALAINQGRSTRRIASIASSISRVVPSLSDGLSFACSVFKRKIDNFYPRYVNQRQEGCTHKVGARVHSSPRIQRTNPPVKLGSWQTPSIGFRIEARKSEAQARTIIYK